MNIRVSDLLVRLLILLLGKLDRGGIKVVIQSGRHGPVKHCWITVGLVKYRWFTVTACL